MKPRPVHLDEVQGRGEEHSKLYEWYSARVPEPLTKQFAKSTGKVLGFAQKRAHTVHMFGDKGVPGTGLTPLETKKSHGTTDNPDKSLAGFTIVETMIVLAVSGFLIVSALLMVGGQQQKAQFNQSVRDLDSKIQDVINDISSGYYQSFGTSYICYISMASPPIAYPRFATAIGGAGPNPGQGANNGCTSVGRVIQFGVAGTNRQGFNIYTIAGRRNTYLFNIDDPPTESQSIYDAMPIPVAPGNNFNNYNTFTNWGFSGGLDITEKNTILNGLSIGAMYYTDASGNNHDIGAVGFFTTFAGYNIINGNLLAGSSSTDVLPILPAYSGGNGLDKTEQDGVDDIAQYLNPNSFVPHTSPPEINPAGGVTICISDDSTNQRALIKIGKNQGNLTTNLAIITGAACT